MKRIALLLSLLLCLVQLPALEKEPVPEKTREQLEKEKKMAEAKKKRAAQRKKKKKPKEYYRDFMKQMSEATKKGDYAEMEKICKEAFEMFSTSPTWMYNIACAQAKQGKKEEALKSLEKSVELGFRSTEHIQKDKDLESLREDPEFKRIIEKADELNKNIKPTEVKNGIALVSATNLLLNNQLKIFQCMFKLPEKAPEGVLPLKGRKGDTVTEKLNTWYTEGTAAGNHGDFYDNKDGDHSNLRFHNYPQLTRIEYSREMQAKGVDWGTSVSIFFNGNVMGNSSTAGHYSNPRMVQNNPRNIQLQFMKYRANHIYVYPEHRDHDPLENDKGAGKGDVFPANTPYCLISQGSSGSDQPFMNAIVKTFAAFRPEVKKELSKNGLLVPTVQMIFRYCQKSVEKPEDYLNGAAHPTVFMRENIGVLKMVEMAHNIEKDYIPPLVQLKVRTEDKPVQYIDYFDRQPNQAHFTTPCAIARIMRSMKHDFKITVSAEESKDLNNRTLTYHWVVLRGDEDRIKINKQNEEGSVAELIIPYHTRKPVPSRPEIESSRVDIGVFVHNGEYYSAPGFITCFFLDHEIREYDENGRILSVDYNTPKKKYVDPIVSGKKNWKDVYQYAEDGTLLGWKRFRGEMFQEFSAEGSLIKSRDKQGRPLSAKKITYKPNINKNATYSSLAQEETDEVLWYWYENDTALKGEVITKEEYDKRTSNQ